jgi:hypothetical protein
VDRRSAHGIRYLDGVEAEQMRIASSWNMDMHAAELFAKLESATEPGPTASTSECVDRHAQVGTPLRSCYDPRRTFKYHSRECTQARRRHAFSLRDPRVARGLGGVKIPFESNTQLGPITTVDRSPR